MDLLEPKAAPVPRGFPTSPDGSQYGRFVEVVKSHCPRFQHVPFCPIKCLNPPLFINSPDDYLGSSRCSRHINITVGCLTRARVVAFLITATARPLQDLPCTCNQCHNHCYKTRPGTVSVIVNQYAAQYAQMLPLPTSQITLFHGRQDGGLKCTNMISRKGMKRIHICTATLSSWKC